jgi:hypothetical protein
MLDSDSNHAAPPSLPLAFVYANGAHKGRAGSRGAQRDYFEQLSLCLSACAGGLSVLTSVLITSNNRRELSGQCECECEWECECECG